MIDKVDTVGRSLIKSKHFASPAINEKCEEVSGSWKELLDQAAKRKKNLDAAQLKQMVRGDLY